MFHEAASDPETEVQEADEPRVVVHSSDVVSQSGSAHPAIPPLAGQGKSTSRGSDGSSTPATVAAERQSPY